MKKSEGVVQVEDGVVTLYEVRNRDNESVGRDLFHDYADAEAVAEPNDWTVNALTFSYDDSELVYGEARR